MKKIIFLVAVSFTTVASAASGAVRPLSLIREGGGFLQKGSAAEWVDIDGEKVLKLSSGVPGKSWGRMNWLKVDLERFRGKEFDFVFVYKTVGATQAAAAWDKTGKAKEPFRPACLNWWRENPEYATWIWPRFDLPEGGTTDGWIEHRERLYIGPNDDLTKAGAFLSASVATGDVYVKDWRLEIPERPFMDEVVEKAGAKVPANYKCRYSKKWLDGKKYRGTVAIWSFKPEDFEKIASWGCNLVRMSRFQPLKDDYAKLEANLKVLKERNGRVIFAPAAPGGKGNRKKYAIFNDDAMREAYLQGWEKLARHFKGRDEIWAFGLLNEPFQGLFGNPGDKYSYWQLEYEAIDRIRAIDPDRPIVASADFGGGPGDYSLAYMRPFPFKDVWYEIHFYSPLAYTHYQVLGKNLDLSKPTQTYPGISVFKGDSWDKDKLEAVFRASEPFREKYGARYFVGEFSVMRRMPGAERWLDDVCEICDKYVDLWTYHSYGEFHGWNLEYDESSPFERPAKVRPGEESARMKVMKKHWAKNHHD